MIDVGAGVISAVCIAAIVVAVAMDRFERRLGELERKVNGERDGN